MLTAVGVGEGQVEGEGRGRLLTSYLVIFYIKKWFLIDLREREKERGKERGRGREAPISSFPHTP